MVPTWVAHLNCLRSSGGRRGFHHRRIGLGHRHQRIVVIGVAEANGLLAILGDRDFGDVEVERLRTRCVRSVERGIAPLHLLRREPEPFSKRIGEGALETLPVGWVVVHEPRLVERLISVNDQLARLLQGKDGDVTNGTDEPPAKRPGHRRVGPGEGGEGGAPPETWMSFRREVNGHVLSWAGLPETAARVWAATLLRQYYTSESQIPDPAPVCRVARGWRKSPGPGGRKRILGSGPVTSSLTLVPETTIDL